MPVTIPFQLWTNENIAVGLSPNAPVQAGISNQDAGGNPEKNLLLPYIVNPQWSFHTYLCWVEVELDAGAALHKPLPQSPAPFDDLGLVDVNDSEELAGTVYGVNTISEGQFQDVIQRVATSTYIFKLRGMAIRLAYPVPIPKLVTVAGVPAVPAERQIAYNVLSGNLGGVPVYRARWDKWYYITRYPTQIDNAPDNLAVAMTGDRDLPEGGIAVPFSTPDWNAVAIATNTLTTLPPLGK